jgi:tRNA-2-methylthio-N6-dimethylallyladenosine synthase
MMDLMTDNKVHDENRQGEAYAPFANDPNQYKKRFYIESYGCAMNFSDSEIVASILNSAGYGATRDTEEADLVLLNTCSIREKAEQTIRKRLTEFRKAKMRRPGLLVGVLGCMAERLKANLLEEEKLVDMVVGPDAYRTLPGLIEEAEGGQKAVNVLLSRDETYADISPVRLESNGVSAFISIMRGCNNMCSFCVVPFTRGRERSRDAQSIVAEAQDLFDRGFREVTLLGQNVDSYYFVDEKSNETVSFAMLMERVALVSPLLRVRFSTSHPKDITDDVLHTIAKYENICNIITGFCSETEEEHQDTLSIMEYSQYDYGYMFFYSERPGTLAARRYKDDVPEDVKRRRLQEIVDKQYYLSLDSNKRDIGQTFQVLIEGDSKKDESSWMGRSSQNKVIVFPKENYELKKGDYVMVKVHDCTKGTLLGTITNQ